MAGDDYVWFLYTRHPDEVILNKAPWLQPSATEKQQDTVFNLTEGDVAKRRQAFYSLKMVYFLCICVYWLQISERE